jgi:hypothetical protein
MHNWPQLGLIQVKRQMSTCYSIGATQKDLPVSDFCLGSQALTGIADQASLMDWMVLRAGIDPSSTARSTDPALLYEAPQVHRQQCTPSLASPRSAEPMQVPSFCANQTYFGDLRQQVGNSGLGGASND